jgi:hypothetical protein
LKKGMKEKAIATAFGELLNLGERGLVESSAPSKVAVKFWKSKSLFDHIGGDIQAATPG